MKYPSVKSAEKVIFSKDRKGYNIQQVDRYIELLSGEYDTVCAKYKNTLERCKELEKQAAHVKTHSRVISKTLVDAEVMAGRIIANAEAEAEKIKADAYIQKVAAARSVELSNDYMRQTISKLQDMITA